MGDSRYHLVIKTMTQERIRPVRKKKTCKISHSLLQKLDNLALA